MDNLVRMLGGWPDHFKEEEKRHGESILGMLRRERMVDESVFGMVVRYAVHRAAYDRLSKEIADDAFVVTASAYMSGKEQSRAFHENKLGALERELLATPAARSKGGLSAQTSFMELLGMPAPTDGSRGKVMPFKPMAKKGSGV